MKTLVILLFSQLVSFTSLSSVEKEPLPLSQDTSSIFIWTNTVFDNPIDMLWKGSDTFNEGLALLEERSIPIYLLTFEESTAAEWWKQLAEYGLVRPMHNNRGVLTHINIVINTSRLQKQARSLGLPLSQVEKDIAVVLAHEIYGHAIPYLNLEPSRGKGPPDTEENCLLGMVDTHECANIRENLIRKELGVPLRDNISDGGLPSMKVPDTPSSSNLLND